MFEHPFLSCGKPSPGDVCQIGLLVIDARGSGRVATAWNSDLLWHQPTLFLIIAERQALIFAVYKVLLASPGHRLIALHSYLHSAYTPSHGTHFDFWREDLKQRLEQEAQAQAASSNEFFRYGALLCFETFSRLGGCTSRLKNLQLRKACSQEASGRWLMQKSSFTFLLGLAGHASADPSKLVPKLDEACNFFRC